MILIELRNLSDAFMQFFQIMPNPSKLQILENTRSYQNLSMFYADTLLFHTKIRKQIELFTSQSHSTYSSQEIIGQNNQTSEQEVQEYYQESQNIDPNPLKTQKESQNPQQIKSLPGEQKQKYSQIIKLKNPQPKLQTRKILQIIENLQCLLKYENKIQIFRQQIQQLNIRFKNYAKNVSNLKNSQEKYAINRQEFDTEQAIQHIIDVIYKCKQSYRELQKIHDQQNSQLNDNLSSSNTSNRSLLTQIINKSNLITTPTHRAQKNQLEKKGFSISSKKQRHTYTQQKKLIIQQIDFQNYQIGSKPKQKKVKNLNYGQCSKCNIF